MTTIKKLSKVLSEMEGKKKQVNIAQITEIVGNLSDLVYDIIESEDIKAWEGFVLTLHENGKRRAEKRKKTK